MDIGNVKIIDVNGGVTVAWRRLRCNSYIGGLVKEYAGTVCVQEVGSPNRRENRVSSIEENMVTPS